MIKVELLNKTKKKKIIEILKKDYGIENLPYLFIKTGKEKIRCYSGSLSWDELNNLAKTLNIELIGLQLCTIENERSRLNFDIMNLPIIKSQISENIINISNEQLNEWLKGKNLEISNNFNSSFVAVKHENDFYGIANNRKSFLQNYVPKEKRR